MVSEDNDHRTAWAGADSAVLCVDPDGDNAIRNADQYVFSDWDPSASSDMEALRDIPSAVLAILALLGHNCLAEAKSQETIAISAIVTGNDQRVGFRAMVMKQTIAYNFAGSAKNDANDIVAFTLQGHRKRVDKAVETIRAGTRKSSNIDVKTAPAAVDPKLGTFTVVDWTSTSRQITTPYTLVFRLRDTDEAISDAEAKDVRHEILKTTLKGDDLKKLGGND